MNHLLAFLLTIAGTAAPSPADAAPSALVVYQAPLSIDHALGVWNGNLIQANGARRPLEVSFTDGLRPQTLFAYFRLGKPDGAEMTVRRLGRLANDELVFDLREGGRVALRLISGRLVGPVVDPAGQLAVKAASAIELQRRWR